MVYIMFETQSITVRIIDDYYSFADLLKEVCRYFDLSTENYKIIDHDNKPINFTIMVNSFMSKIQNKISKYLHNKI